MVNVVLKIKKKIKKAKEIWNRSKCGGIEIKTLESQYDNFNLHKKVKEATGIYRSKTDRQNDRPFLGIVAMYKGMEKLYQNYVQRRKV